MKLAPLLSILLLAGCSRPQPSFVDQAEPAVQRELTNDIVGYSRTIGIRMDWPGTDPNRWTAIATVEYVNHHGGIERTDVPYKFYLATNGALIALEDWQKKTAR